MDLVVNIAPVAVALLVCAIAWVSVRRAHRKAMASRAEEASAAE
jgi:hypothetical protein